MSATAAAPLPPAEVHSVPTSDGTEIRLTRYKFGTKGPLVLAPGYGNAASAFAIDTVPKNWVQYLGEHGYDVWLLDYRASPNLPGELHAVHRRRHRDARLARGRRRGAQGDRRGRRSRRWGTASAGSRCSWPWAAGWRACAAPRSRASPATRSPRRATRRAPGPGWPRCSRRSASSAWTSSTTPSAGTASSIETVMKLVPFRHVYDNPIARRIYFVYGDVYDYENINQPTMEQAVPGFFGGGNMTFFEHISLMIRAERGARRARQERVLGEPRELQGADQLHHRRAQQDVRAEGPAALV